MYPIWVSSSCQCKMNGEVYDERFVVWQRREKSGLATECKMFHSMLLGLSLHSSYLSALICLVQEVSCIKGRHWGEEYTYFLLWCCAFHGGFDSAHYYPNSEIQWHEAGQTHRSWSCSDPADGADALLWIPNLPLANHLCACKTHPVQNQWIHTVTRQRYLITVYNKCRD